MKNFTAKNFRGQFLGSQAIKMRNYKFNHCFQRINLNEKSLFQWAAPIGIAAYQKYGFAGIAINFINLPN